MIKLEQLHKYFNRRRKNEIHVLNNITFDLPEKGLVVLLGASGSGKTTLLNVLGGLDKIHSGSINFDDQKITGYPSHKWDIIRNEKIGYIFQNYNLLPELSVYDNIAFVLNMIGIKDPTEVQNRVHYILKAVGMYPFRKKKATQLSGGQMQRVAIARALVKNPRIIIADEPTGNLDSKNTVDIMNIIREISKTKLVVLVTHEKNIANVYGDRIITLSDGRIISDQINDQHENLVHDNDQAIYLKDLKTWENNKSNHLEMALYSDEDEELDLIKVRLILRNKTLYLDVDSKAKKVIVLDEQSGIVVKDEHYRQKSKQELMETSYDSTILDHSNIKKEIRMVTATKQSFKLAFYKVLKTSRKGKLMLFSFFTAGVVLAFALAMLFAVVLLKPSDVSRYGEGYLEVRSTIYDDSFGFASFHQEYDSNGDLELLPNVSMQINFRQPNGSNLDLGYGALELADSLKKSDLVHGRLPVNANEIVISKGIADAMLDSTITQENGIRNYLNLYHEVIIINNQAIKIVGVHNTKRRAIFASKDVFYLSNLTLIEFTASDNLSLLPDSYITVVSGSKPTASNQLVISQTKYKALFGEAATWSGPVDYPSNSNYQISGLHNTLNYDYYAFMTVSFIEQNYFNNILGTTSSFLVYATDYKTLESRLTNDSYDVVNPYLLALENLKHTRTQRLAGILSVSGVLIGFSGVGFYFVIRSSLISRIYEVSVYRALGIRKKEIFVSFIIEIFVLTTLSTLVGFTVANMMISRLNQGLFSLFGLFEINTFTVIIGVILVYLLNILAGLLPVYRLLTKTPAQILAQYDI